MTSGDMLLRTDLGISNAPCCSDHAIVLIAVIFLTRIKDTEGASFLHGGAQVVWVIQLMLQAYTLKSRFSPR